MMIVVVDVLFEWFVVVMCFGVMYVFDVCGFDVFVLQDVICVVMGGFGVDVSFEVVGLQVMFELVMWVLCKGGCVVMVGLMLYVGFDVFCVVNDELIFIVSVGYWYVYEDLLCIVVLGVFDFMLIVMCIVLFEDVVVDGFDVLFVDCMQIKIFVLFVQWLVCCVIIIGSVEYELLVGV